MRSSTEPGEARPPAVVDLIRRKRDGGRLAPDELGWLVGAYARHEVPDYQMAAFLMAVYLNGLDDAELASLTGAMIDSGERLDLAGLSRPTVDKHSTGGVGDKVSVVVGPLLAAAGACVPQLSGRGLGHTGGTLDKLEAIPGFRTDLSPAEMVKVLDEVGCVICAPGPGLAPADRRLYQLRDATATVDSVPLIASSIMSKKIAEGTAALVLDVKVGSGAFMPDVGSARHLAETLIGIGTEHGVATTAVLSRMDEPIGRAVGNAVEVNEAVATLRGDGPADLVELTLALGEEMASLAGLPVARTDGARAALEEMLTGGPASAAYRSMVLAQGGDPDAALPEANERAVVVAERAGVLRRLDARTVGEAAWRLGAGRTQKEHPVSKSAGVICRRKPGEPVERGEPVLEARAEDPRLLPPALELLQTAMEIGDEAPERLPLVIEVVRQ